jgi:hypothetical protein
VSIAPILSSHHPHYTTIPSSPPHTSLSTKEEYHTISKMLVTIRPVQSSYSEGSLSILFDTSSYTVIPLYSFFTDPLALPVVSPPSNESTRSKERWNQSLGGSPSARFDPSSSILSFPVPSSSLPPKFCTAAALMSLTFSPGHPIVKVGRNLSNQTHGLYPSPSGPLVTVVELNRVE